jgi:hypothetical protein
MQFFEIKISLNNCTFNSIPLMDSFHVNPEQQPWKSAYKFTTILIIIKVLSAERADQGMREKFAASAEVCEWVRVYCTSWSSLNQELVPSHEQQHLSIYITAGWTSTMS